VTTLVTSRLTGVIYNADKRHTVKHKWSKQITKRHNLQTRLVR